MQQIHTMTTWNIQACAEILKENYEKPPYNEVFQKDYHIKYIEIKLTKNPETSFVLKENDQIIGFCICSLHFWTNGLQAILEDIDISPNFQGKWYGQQLYDFVENELKRRGIQSIMLWANTSSHASHFYEKNGFSASCEKIFYKNL